MGGKGRILVELGWKGGSRFRTPVHRTCRVNTRKEVVPLFSSYLYSTNWFLVDRTGHRSRRRYEVRDTFFDIHRTVKNCKVTRLKLFMISSVLSYLEIYDGTELLLIIKWYKGSLLKTNL